MYSAEIMATALEPVVGPNTLPLMITPQQAVEITGLPYKQILRICKSGKVANLRSGESGGWRFKINRISLIRYLSTAGTLEEGAEEDGE